MGVYLGDIVSLGIKLYSLIGWFIHFNYLDGHASKMNICFIVDSKLVERTTE